MDKSALENATMYGFFFERFSMEKFREITKKLEVPMQRSLCNLSRGEYMKFQLAFAMAHHAKLYLIDEATAGMDPIFRKDFFAGLHKLVEAEDVAVLISTHIEEEIDRHMDYVAVLEEGRLLSFKEVEPA